MEHDSIYTIGRGHTSCQDYAQSGARFAIVSDGCSSSVNSDLGARYLVGAAARRLRICDAELDHGWIVRRAARAAAVLGHEPSCMDATLLCAHMDTDSILRIAVAGDGVVVVETQDGTVLSWQVDDGPAPAYLSYWLNKARLQTYFATWGDRRTVIKTRNGQVIGRANYSILDEYVFRLKFEARSVKAVFLLTDGIGSFTDIEGSAVPTEAVIDEVCAIKSYRGAFVKRRLKRFLTKTCRQKHWSHEDDLGIAALEMSYRDLENSQ